MFDTLAANRGAFEEITDEELAELALAADPEVEVDPGAPSFWDLARSGEQALLPEWYMPTPLTATRQLKGWRRRTAIMIVVAFLLIDAAGLCSTYGLIVIA